LSDLNVAATVIDRPEAFRERLFAMDNVLQNYQMGALSTYRNTEFPAEDRRNAVTKLSDIHEIRALIGVPLHVNGTTDPRLKDIILGNPIDTPFYVIDSAGTRPFQITQELKDLYTSEER